MLKASAILAHPYERSFNHAIFDTAVAALIRGGVETYAHDLYAEGFDPVITSGELGKVPSEDELVNRYARELVESDILLFVHPNWWGQPPAILKGYIDRVIRPPHAYDFPAQDTGGGLPVEKLKGKIGLVYNTANTGGDRENNYFGDPLENIWEKCVFGFTGVKMGRRRMFRIIADSTVEERRSWLRTVEEDVMSLLDGSDH